MRIQNKIFPEPSYDLLNDHLRQKTEKSVKSIKNDWIKELDETFRSNNVFWP
jgi:hypothetical protein